jgi:hypothetical protein
MDEGKKMIKDALTEAPRDAANKMLSENYGVTLGNLSDEANYTPSQKMVNSIAAAEQHPKNVSWVVEEQKSDYMTYILVSVILLIWVAGYFFLQKIAPEQAGKITEALSGAEQFLGYGLYVKTLVLLIAIPTLLPFALDYSITLEQGLTDGIMHDSLEYISLSTENIPLYFFQAISYTLSGVFFLARIQLINTVYAKVLILGLVLAIPWDFIRYLGVMVLLYFETALFMRPLVLWIAAVTVKTVHGMSNADAFLIAPQLYGTMTIVTVIIVFLATCWPLIYVIICLLRSRPVRVIRRTSRGF